MKNIYNTLGMTKACLCALAVSLVTTGCSDLLDKEPPSAISDGSFWTGEGDAMLALTGCYRFQTGWLHDKTCNKSLTSSLQCRMSQPNERNGKGKFFYFNG